MKIGSVLIALAAAQDAAEREYEDDTWYGPAATAGPRSGAVIALDGEDRRYDDLTGMASKYFKKQGMKGKDKFNEKKYWAYGCHCFILGDRAMSEMGHGAPKDALDTKCKAYKDCQKCVREKYGDECIGEAVRYTWKWSSKNNRLETKNGINTCEHELFNCDAKLAADTFAAREVWNQDWHGFWSELPGGFDNREPDHCPTNGGNPVDHECCGGATKPFLWVAVGPGHNQCCADPAGGIVKDYNDQC